MRQVKDSHPEMPLYPLFLYIYDKDGMHGEPIQINSEEQLGGVGVRLVLRDAMASKVEIRMTDPGDFLVFHAQHGVVIFPPQEFV